jgi:hypothetical protein
VLFLSQRLLQFFIGIDLVQGLPERLDRTIGRI